MYVTVYRDARAGLRYFASVKFHAETRRREALALAPQAQAQAQEQKTLTEAQKHRV
jgi:hypothetical protein